LSSKVISNGRLPEKDRVVPHLGLHGFGLSVRGFQLPRLVVQASEIGHRIAGTGRDDEPGLHLLGIQRGRREVQPDAGAILALFGSDEHPIADHEKLLLGEVHGPGTA
jgi:hypothetical protein